MWLEKHICVVCFRRLACQVTRNKKHVLKIPSSKVYRPQSRGFSAFQLYIFCSNALCGLAQFRFEPSSKKHKSRKRLCKSFVFTLHCSVLSMQQHYIFKNNLDTLILSIYFLNLATSWQVGS